MRIQDPLAYERFNLFPQILAVFKKIDHFEQGPDVFFLKQRNQASLTFCQRHPLLNKIQE